MPYNTRRKSLSLPSLGIHVPVTQAERTAAAKSRSSMSSTASDSHDAHPSKRLKRSHPGAVPEEALEQTPPPSPKAIPSIEMADAAEPTPIDLDSINDDIVEAVIVQLQATANRPHLVKELATVLGQSLTSVQQSANPCAIISSRLASFLKRPTWTAKEACPLAKELETVHPRRTYFFLTTHPRQALPDFNAAQPASPVLVTPSVSLTDDSVSDEVEGRRRELSPSPEVDLSSTEFEEGDEEDMVIPGSPVGSLAKKRAPVARTLRRTSPPLEGDEKEFTHTANILLKRKLSHDARIAEMQERIATTEYGFRDDLWFNDPRIATSAVVFSSPAIKPVSAPLSRKEEEADSWLKLSKVIEWDRDAESIEMDELDYLLDSY